MLGEGLGCGKADAVQLGGAGDDSELALEGVGSHSGVGGEDMCML